VSELNLLTLAEARDGLMKKSFSAVELADAHLSAMEKARALNAYVLETPERASAMAKASDTRIAAGKTGPLEGIPLAVKDMFCTEGVRSTACSHILDNFVPTYDSTVTANLWRDGAVLLGKTNNDEFAMGSSNETSQFGPVISPWRRKGANTPLTPGGSSGGSAAAVAANLCLGATGTDTGGSIRQPGAFCGVVGLKPTYGRVSRYGLIAFASSLDHVGPFGKTVKDVALILQHMAGRDPMDSTSADLPVPDYTGEIGKPVTGLRIGVPKEYFGEGLDPEVRAAVEAGIQELAKAGCEVVSVSLPHTEYAIPTYYLIATAEASSNLARFDGVRYGMRAREAKTLAEMYRKTRDAGFGTEVKRRIMLGTYALSAGYYDAYYLKAQKVRSLLARDFDEAFAKVDAIVTPTTPTPAFKLGEKADDPLAMYLADIYTVTANLVGVPGITVPCGKSREGLPIGMQILGKHFDEATVLKAAHVAEHALADNPA